MALAEDKVGRRWETKEQREALSTMRTSQARIAKSGNKNAEQKTEWREPPEALRWGPTEKGATRHVRGFEQQSISSQRRGSSS